MNSRHAKRLMIVLLASAAAAWMAVQSVQGESSSTKEPARPASSGRTTKTPSAAQQAQQLYEQGKASVGQKDFTAALRLFTQANRLNANDADILNMLAYSHRKLGRLDDAFTYYRRALKLRPRFAEAREYLGEAHIQAAVREIKILQGYGNEGREQAEELIEALKKAVATFEDDKSPDKTTPSRMTKSRRR